MSATLQTMSIIVANLQGNRAVFRIFITLLNFSFDSPSYVHYGNSEMEEMINISAKNSNENLLKKTASSLKLNLAVSASLFGRFELTISALIANYNRVNT